jgi:predicted Zn finger-like uncharacterized protein
MKFRCEHCGTKYSLADETVRGRILKIRCRKCTEIMMVRDPERSIGSSDSVSADDLRQFLARSGERMAVSAVQWYLAKDGNRKGPMSEQEVADALRTGSYSPTDFAWRAGMTDWSPVRNVPELAPLLDALVEPPPLPPPVPPGLASPAESKPGPDPEIGSGAPRVSEPAAAVDPEPAAAVDPEPAAAVDPEPAAAVDPEPVAAVHPEPAAAVQLEPAVAVQSEPAAAVQPEPVTAMGPDPEQASPVEIAGPVIDDALPTLAAIPQVTPEPDPVRRPAGPVGGQEIRSPSDAPTAAWEGSPTNPLKAYGAAGSSADLELGLVVEQTTGSGPMGEETRMFLLASGLTQGVRRRMMILAAGVLLIGGFAVGIGMGFIPSPFGGGIDKAAFRENAPRMVRLMLLGEAAGTGPSAAAMRVAQATVLVDALVEQDAVIEAGYAFEIMTLEKGDVELRLGRGDFSKCTGGAADAGPVSAFDCPDNSPGFLAFPSSREAEVAMAAIDGIELVKTARETFGTPSDGAVILPYQRGEKVDREAGARALECLMGGCLDDFVEAKVAASEKAEAEADRLARQLASRRTAAKSKAGGRGAAKRGAEEVDEDPAVRAQRLAQAKAAVSSGDLRRMAAVQRALGAVRLQVPKLAQPPGRVSQLDLKAAARVVARGQRGVQACVSRSMRRGQGFHGELRVHLIVQPSGRVSTMKVLTEAYKGLDVTRCIGKRVTRWRFPSFPGEEPTALEIPWKLPKR